jgi:hypothetical protein
MYTIERLNYLQCKDVPSERLYDVGRFLLNGHDVNASVIFFNKTTLSTQTRIDYDLFKIKNSSLSAKLCYR